MSTFQIHEDMENNRSKIPKKLIGEGDERKIVKKKFGENNPTVTQGLNLKGLRDCQKTGVIVKNGKPGRDQGKKPKNMSDNGRDKTEKEHTKNVLVVDSFLKTENKENIQTDQKTAVNIYCPFSELHNEYGEDIYKYLRSLEETGPRVKPTFMMKQVELNWTSRSILIDWLVSVSDEYELSHETLHLSINYIDRFLSSISVVRNKFQLVGAAAMRLATKMEEYQPFDAKEWSYLTGDSFTSKQILKMEQIILRVLNFNMKSPTICDFIQHLSSEYEMDEETIHLSLYISELVLLEGDEYLKHFPSKLAAASIALARFYLSKPNPWPAKLKKVSGYTLRELSPIVQKQHKTLEDSPMKDQKAVATKYKSPKYSKVALRKPRKLSLDSFESNFKEDL